MTTDSTPTPAGPLCEGAHTECRTCGNDITKCVDLATPAAAAEMPQQMGMVLINGHRYRRPVITVAVVTFDGASCVVPVNELQDVLGDGNEYTVQIKTMRKAEFERMPEFGGW